MGRASRRRAKRQQQAPVERSGGAVAPRGASVERSSGVVERSTPWPLGLDRLERLDRSGRAERLERSSAARREAVQRSADAGHAADRPFGRDGGAPPNAPQGPGARPAIEALPRAPGTPLRAPAPVTARRPPYRQPPPAAFRGLARLTELHAARVEIHKAIAEEVQRVVALGTDWGTVGRALGVSRQAARQRYGSDGR